MAEVLEAGIELDARIAAAVMQLRVFPSWGSRQMHEARRRDPAYPFAVIDRAALADPAGELRVYGTSWCDGYVWRPSRVLADAWDVVAEVQRRYPGWRFMLLGGDVSFGYIGGSPQKGVDETRLEAFGWRAEYFGHVDPRLNHGDRHGSSFAETAPLAICLASLEATEKGAVAEPNRNENATTPEHGSGVVSEVVECQ